MACHCPSPYIHDGKVLLNAAVVLVSCRASVRDSQGICWPNIYKLLTAAWKSVVVSNTGFMPDVHFSAHADDHEVGRGFSIAILNAHRGHLHARGMGPTSEMIHGQVMTHWHMEPGNTWFRTSTSAEEAHLEGSHNNPSRPTSHIYNVDPSSRS